MAHLSALFIAIDQIGKNGNRNDMIVYGSSDTHFSMPKMCKLAGVQFCSVETCDKGAINVTALKKQIQADLAKKLKPLMIVANAGTTVSGAIDPFQTLYDVAQEHGMWTHVDACYGGFFKLTQYGRTCLQGMELADSISTDPHKGLFLPFGTGCLLVKNLLVLKSTFAYDTPSYLQTEHLTSEDTNSIEYYDFMNMSIETTRPFRGLRIWLPLQFHGEEAFIQCTQERTDLIMLVNEKLMQHQDKFVIVSPPQLSVMLVQAVAKDHDANTLTMQVCDQIRKRAQVALTTSVLKGKMCIRIITQSCTVDQESVEKCIYEMVQSYLQVAQ